MRELHTIAEIKAAVDAGEPVRCDGGGYEVIRDSIGQYLIHFIPTDYYIGLHGMEGTQYANCLNGRGFYVTDTP
jgi:hypothetical protein